MKVFLFIPVLFAITSAFAYGADQSGNEVSAQSGEETVSQGESVSQPMSEKEAGFLAGIFDESKHIYFQTSLLTKHFNPKPEHNNTQKLIDLHWQWQSQYLVGASFFQNSFDQPTQFVYVGRSWDIPYTNDLLYVNLVGGLLHGYKGEHKEDIPLNDHGVAPGILPALGFRYSHIHSQLIFFGTAGLTWTVGFDFPVN